MTLLRHDKTTPQVDLAVALQEVPHTLVLRWTVAYCNTDATPCVTICNTSPLWWGRDLSFSTPFFSLHDRPSFAGDARCCFLPTTTYRPCRRLFILFTLSRGETAHRLQLHMASGRDHSLRWEVASCRGRFPMGDDCALVGRPSFYCHCM